MEQNNQTGQPMEHKKVGPIVVTLVVVLVLVIVGLYIFASKISQQTVDMTNSNSDTQTVVQTQTISTVTSTADDVQSLQNDLGASVNGIDSQTF